MPIVNPLLQGGAPAGSYTTPQPAEGPADMAPTVSAHGTSGFNLGNLGGGFTHPDNTSAHVGCAVAIAFLVIVGFKVAGFRFSVDAGVAGG
jgi:hypothetical protein